MASSMLSLTVKKFDDLQSNIKIMQLRNEPLQNMNMENVGTVHWSRKISSFFIIGTKAIWIPICQNSVE